MKKLKPYFDLIADIIIILAIVIWSICAAFIIIKESDKSKDSVKNDYTIVINDSIQIEMNKDNFYYICELYDIKHPEIVYAQARLESGNFTSQMFKEKNNFLGIYNSIKHEYEYFNHWSDCLLAYKTTIQNKWNGKQDYLLFLEELPYAMDEQYIVKIKSLTSYGKMD